MSVCGDSPTGRMRRVKRRAGSATGAMGLCRAQMMQKPAPDDGSAPLQRRRGDARKALLRVLVMASWRGD